MTSPLEQASFIADVMESKEQLVVILAEHHVLYRCGPVPEVTRCQQQEARKCNAEASYVNVTFERINLCDLASCLVAAVPAQTPVVPLD